MDTKYKSIFKPQLARRLLKMNNPIVDIKASKENSDRTVFIFEITEKFLKDLAILNE